MTTVSRDDIEKLHSRVTATALDVASMKSTINANAKQTDKIVTLLQGNGQSGLVGKVAEVKVRVRNCETELKSRKLNNQINKRATIARTVALVLGISTLVLGVLAVVLPVFFHFLSH